MDNLKKKFPSYFNNFELPEGAKGQNIKVFRACKTRKVDKESFLTTFEEKDGHIENINDPGEYSLSTFEKPKDIKRFVNMNNEFGKPYKIAKGSTEAACGISQRTKERKPKHKNSHVDWWIYENAEPHQYFELIEDFEKFYEDYNKVEESKHDE